MEKLINYILKRRLQFNGYVTIVELFFLGIIDFFFYPTFAVTIPQKKIHGKIVAVIAVVKLFSVHLIDFHWKIIESIALHSHRHTN